MDSNKKYFIMLSMVEGLGPRLTTALLKIFGSPEGVWYAPEAELRKIPKFPERVINNLVVRRNSLDPDEELARLARNGIRVIYIDEPQYPPLLKHIFDPPRILYARGNLAAMQLPMFAIVGARKASHYGLAMAEKIAYELARAGICIVSGMARGIDSAAHRGALSAGGLTVAVLGCGIDVVYPRENKKLMEEIAGTGVVISEFPPGTKPVAGNFPQRNRIISGLSEGVLVIEAADKSGSLITADFALEQGREVFALPGQVTNPLNRGAHKLIKQGAHLVESAGDILAELGVDYSFAGSGTDSVNNPELEKLTGSQRQIYNNISDDPVSVEAIIVKTGLQAREVLSALLEMEIKGLVRQLAGEKYVRVI